MKKLQVRLALTEQETEQLKALNKKLIDHLEEGFSLKISVLDGLKSLLSEVVANQLGIREALETIEKTGEDILVQLMHSDNEILNLPWSYAVDPVSNKTLGTIPELMINKCLSDLNHSAEEQIRGLPPPLKVLVMFSSPEDSEEKLRISFEEEEMSILRAFQPLMKTRKVQLDFTNDGSLDELRRKISSNTYHIMHFSGNAVFKEGSGYLMLESSYSFNTNFLEATEFADALNCNPNYKIPIVILSSCQTAQDNNEEGLQDFTNQLLRIGIPAVIYMGRSIQDNYASYFTAQVYENIIKNITLTEAFHKAIDSLRVFENGNLKKSGISNPEPLQWIIPNLYLSTAIDYPVVWDMQEEKLDFSSSQYIFENQYTWIFARLQSYNLGVKPGRSVGEKLLSRFVSLLSASRLGLGKNEIVDLFDEGDQQNISAIFLFLLRRYLIYKGRLIDFNNVQFRVVAKKVWLNTYHKSQVMHAQLADYFRDKIDPDKNDSWRGNYTRGWSEFMYHMVHTGRMQEVNDLLMNFNWMRGKLNATDVQSLIDDYNLLIENRKESLDLVRNAICLSKHVLSIDPGQLATQLTGRLMGIMKLEIIRLTNQVDAWRGAPWFRPKTNTLSSPRTNLLKILMSHDSPLRTVTISPNGQLAVSGSSNGILKVWDLDSETEVHSIKAHTDDVFKVTISHDGRHLLSCSADKTIKVFSLDTFRHITTLSGHTGKVFGIVISSDDKYAISASSDHTLKVWDINKYREVYTLIGHNSWVAAVAIIPGQSKVVSISPEERVIRIWDINKGIEIGKITNIGDSSIALLVTPNGRSVLTCSKGDLVSYDLKTMKKNFWCEGSGQIRSLAVSLDGHRILSANYNGLISVYDYKVDWKLAGHAGEIFDVAIFPDGKRAISASADKTLRVWNIEYKPRSSIKMGHSLRTTRIEIAKNNLRAISCSDDGTIKVWDVKTGAEICTFSQHNNRIKWASFLPDGKSVISVSDCYGLTLNHEFRIWDLESGVEKAYMESRGYIANGTIVNDRWAVISDTCSWLYKLNIRHPEFGRISKIGGQKGNVRSMATLPDGKNILCGSLSGELRLWHLTRDLAKEYEWRSLMGDPKESTLLGDHNGSVSAVAIADNGNRAISVSSSDPYIKIWNLNSCKIDRILNSHNAGVSDIAITPDSRYFLTVSSTDRTLCLWDFPANKVIARFISDTALHCCAISADGKTIITGEENGDIQFLHLTCPSDPNF